KRHRGFHQHRSPGSALAAGRRKSDSSGMALPLRRIVLRLAVAWTLCGGAGAQAPLEPPFGLKWGDSPEKLISWASRHSLDVNISLPGKQPALRIVSVSGDGGSLPDSPADAVEG